MRALAILRFARGCPTSGLRIAYTRIRQTPISLRSVQSYSESEFFREAIMSNAWLDILQAWGTVAGSSATVAAMAPVYAAIWVLSWLAAEQAAGGEVDQLQPRPDRAARSARPGNSPLRVRRRGPARSRVHATQTLPVDG